MHSKPAPEPEVQPEAAPAQAPTVPISNDHADGIEWVAVVLKGEKDMPPGYVTREWLDGWGRDKGWTEVK